MSIKHRSARILIAAIGLRLLLMVNLYAQSDTRKEIQIPDIPGFLTLKCDFHMHTVFSDGNVWPTVRVEEAWREGLDAIAITDHLEYQPHEQDVKTDPNRPYDLAMARAQALEVILIKGTEITRSMPPGHFNALFIKDAALINQDDFLSAVSEAVRQKAFIFWNHPGWRGQQPDGISKWYDIHTELENQGWLHGIEMVNGPEYYPKAHQWCIDKNLTIIGNSDIHGPTFMTFDFSKGAHRSMTLVFTKERTAESIQEALQTHRTAIYQDDHLYGDAAYLLPLFNASIRIKNPKLILTGRASAHLQITNETELPFNMELEKTDLPVSVTPALVLPPRHTSVITIRAISRDMTGEKQLELPYRVSNLQTAPQTGLPVTLPVQIVFKKSD